MALQYKKLSSSELVMGQEVLDWLLEDDEIMSVVGNFHDEGKRCALVVWLEDGEMVDACISDDTALRAEVDLPKVRRAVASYDTTKQICVVVVRDNKNTVILYGDIL